MNVAFFFNTKSLQLYHSHIVYIYMTNLLLCLPKYEDGDNELDQNFMYMMQSLSIGLAALGVAAIFKISINWQTGELTEEILIILPPLHTPSTVHSMACKSTNYLPNW